MGSAVLKNSLSLKPFLWHTIRDRFNWLPLEVVGVDLPRCRKCPKGVLVPLSDYGPRGSDLDFKVWVCTDQTCGFIIRIDKGVINYGPREKEPRRHHEHRRS